MVRFFQVLFFQFWWLCVMLVWFFIVPTVMVIAICYGLVVVFNTFGSWQLPRHSGLILWFACVLVIGWFELLYGPAERTINLFRPPPKTDACTECKRGRE